jgi:hypothetical protein
MTLEENWKENKDIIPPQEKIETAKENIFDILEYMDSNTIEKAITATARAIKLIISQEMSPLNKLDMITKEFFDLKQKLGVTETKAYKSLFLEEFQKDNTSKNLAIRTKKLGSMWEKLL